MEYKYLGLLLFQRDWRWTIHFLHERVIKPFPTLICPSGSTTVSVRFYVHDVHDHCSYGLHPVGWVEICNN